MNEYGCNPTDVPPFLTSFVNDKVDNFTVPTDPCYFDTINVGEILKEINLDEEDYVFKAIADTMYKVPCQIWIDEEIFNTFIDPYGIEYLIDYDYWFVDEGDACNTVNPEENEYEIVIMPCDKQCSHQYLEGIHFVLCGCIP